MLIKVVEMPPDPFQEMEVKRNSALTQQLGHALRSGPEIKKKVSFVVWEDVSVPVAIVSIEVGNNKGNKCWA